MDGSRLQLHLSTPVNSTHMILCSTHKNRLAGIENKMVVTSGRRKRGQDRDMGLRDLNYYA